jgi:hypothetical protein
VHYAITVDNAVHCIIKCSAYQIMSRFCNLEGRDWQGMEHELEVFGNHMFCRSEKLNATEKLLRSWISTQWKRLVGGLDIYRRFYHHHNLRCDVIVGLTWFRLLVNSEVMFILYVMWVASVFAGHLLALPEGSAVGLITKEPSINFWPGIVFCYLQSI